MDDLIAKALHAARHHLAGGGLLSGPDYLSTGEEVSPTNWGNPDVASDFFKADKALRLAREIQAKADTEARRPPIPDRVVEEAPALPRAALRVAAEPSPQMAAMLARAETEPGKVEGRVAPEADKNAARAPQGPELTDRDRDLIIRTIAAETSGKTPEESQAIAHVILNRIQSGKYGASPEAVLLAKKQFEPWSNPAGANYPMNFLPNSRRYGIGQAALESALSGDDITGGALNFWGPKAQYALGRKAPGWAAEMPDYSDIGETRFHRPRADGGEVEGYGDGGKIVKKALDFLRANPELKPYKGGSFSLERQGVYHPKYFDLKKDDLVDEAGNIIASKDVTIPREGFSYDLPAQADPDKIFRGMSAEEFANFQKNKYIQSLGTHNIGEGQKGLTYFSVNPDEARSYAHSFAPSEFKPDPSRPAYVVAAKRPPDESIARVPGTGESEVGVMGQIPREDVTNVYRGNVVDYIEGIHEPGARVSPSSSVHWEEIGDYAHGGEVEAALHMLRHHYATDGYVSSAQRLRDTIASIDPEASQDQPVMDPEKMGEAWDRARRNYQNFPVQEGEAVARPLELGARDVIGGAIAGEARAPGADFRRGVADLLVGSKGLPDSGTLGFGLADAPMLTGVPLTLADMARDVGQGDYGSTAMGAALPAAFYARGPLGAAGRRAVEIAKDYAKPVAAGAAGVAANAVTPEDAEAAKLSKAFNIIRTAERPAESRFVSQAGEHGYFQPQSARERDPRLWHPLSNTVLSRPLGEMTAEHKLLSGLPERKFIRPEDLEGSSLIPALGDRTIGDSLLMGVNGVKFKDPVNMQAGHSFMYGPASRGPDRAVWASDPGVITILSNKAKAASEAGFDPYLSYVAMSPRSGDYSHHMADTLRQMLPQSKVPKDVIAEFDRQMRENTANKWAAYSDWPGLKSKKLEEYLYSTGPGKARTKMAELMGQGQFQKAGLPDVGAARFAITDPELLHAVDYSAGRSIARLDPMGRKITDPSVPHKTYLHQLAAHPDEGYVGGFEYDIPFEVMNKEWIDQIRARDPAAAANPSQLAYTYRLSAPRVDFKPEVVDRLSKFLEMKKMGLIP